MIIQSVLISNVRIKTCVFFLVPRWTQLLGVRRLVGALVASALRRSLPKFNFIESSLL